MQLRVACRVCLFRVQVEGSERSGMDANTSPISSFMLGVQVSRFEKEETSLAPSQGTNSRSFGQMYIVPAVGRSISSLVSRWLCAKANRFSCRSGDRVQSFSFAEIIVLSSMLLVSSVEFLWFGVVHVSWTGSRD